MNGAVPNDFRLERLNREHPRKQFSCGEARVDDWIWTKVLQNQEKHLAGTKVLVDGAGAIAGYYTLAMSEVEFEDAPEDVRKRLPRRRLPIALLAWLGVSAKHQGKGLGARILSIALRDCHDAGKTFAFVAMMIDCINDASHAFFQQWEFTGMANHPRRLFLSAKRLEAMMAVPS
jgi:GNAT superfamily N-acetyltransferase